MEKRLTASDIETHRDLIARAHQAVTLFLEDPTKAGAQDDAERLLREVTEKVGLGIAVRIQLDAIEARGRMLGIIGPVPESLHPEILIGVGVPVTTEVLLLVAVTVVKHDDEETTIGEALLSVTERLDNPAAWSKSVTKIVVGRTPDKDAIAAAVGAALGVKVPR